MRWNLFRRADVADVSDSSFETTVVDDVAAARMATQGPVPEGAVAPPPAGAGRFLWSRGDEYRFEEPPLCEECALRISVGAVLKWESEDEEG